MSVPFVQVDVKVVVAVVMAAVVAREVGHSGEGEGERVSIWITYVYDEIVKQR